MRNRAVVSAAAVITLMTVSLVLCAQTAGIPDLSGDWAPYARRAQIR